ncbi:unnamed protein product [Acanthoscelides obtectus]|nr:unnamed protein product [Acanthoscelides obtectus]CAK1631368.1 hypothetical protein AOBTE_LOCUS6910 [Acanthoscelides obtectus]
MSINPYICLANDTTYTRRVFTTIIVTMTARSDIEDLEDLQDLKDHLDHLDHQVRQALHLRPPVPLTTFLCLQLSLYGDHQWRGNQGFLAFREFQETGYQVYLDSTDFQAGRATWAKLL